MSILSHWPGLPNWLTSRMGRIAGTRSPWPWRPWTTSNAGINSRPLASFNVKSPRSSVGLRLKSWPPLCETVIRGRRCCAGSRRKTCGFALRPCWRWRSRDWSGPWHDWCADWCGLFLWWKSCVTRWTKYFFPVIIFMAIMSPAQWLQWVMQRRIPRVCTPDRPQFSVNKVSFVVVFCSSRRRERKKISKQRRPNKTQNVRLL